MVVERNIPEKKLLGVCAWLSYKFDVDVTLIRIIFLIAAVLGMGSPVIIYLVLFVVKQYSEGKV